MTPISCKVEGMHCTSCAMSLSKYLEKKGMQDVHVSFATEEVSFTAPAGADSKEVLQGINQMGYRVVLPEDKAVRQPIYTTLTFKFFFCLIFTAPLLLHMWVNWSWLHNPWVQCALTLPVYLTGMWHFGRSAFRSLMNRMANMDVLVALGATAAFGYSFVGTVVYGNSDYMFFETTAAIITLVFLGNLLEEKSVKQTTTAIAELAKMQVTTARLINTDHGHEHIHEVDNRALRPGNCVLVNTGDKIPMDGTIYWGSGHINESMITGESTPVSKQEKDKVIGGTILEEGSIKVYITATGKDTVLSYIIELVRQAQNDKAPMQRLADRISAVFVPLVLSIAILTFLGWYFIGHTPFAVAMMRSVAVLVIACPCAMGLATPAAVMVGLGRAAKNGILIKGGHTLELFKDIRQVVFDKTGTLTTGKLQMGAYQFFDMTDEAFRQIVYSLEKYSSHPIARAIAGLWKGAGEVPLQQVREHKGLGMRAHDKAGNEWQLGSFRMAGGAATDDSHNLYLLKNGQLAGWIDFIDEIRPEAATMIQQLKTAGIKPVLLSGDTRRKCQELAEKLGITAVYAEQSPEQKLQQIDAFMKEAPTAMVGDGINDAPALAKATIGISLSDATQVAMQSANVVLLNNNLGTLPLALGLGKHTYQTIRQNLFWAFIYNVVAIPVAALGLLNPIVGAGVMGLSDVVLAINSVRLRYKNVL
ncbi:heavy metal translocating P-type ATPase [Chitinophaga nivalis]|uniref:Cation-translocating P-type ATPase n=1 Tax=Chitinophaga nivalis TaxID=2991709 RepID=A0ABT3IXG5_9BACT|nr:cation-translocating P-type ATPase [Chitinophaga nivalis]MCW3461885.1 cation-translocating P-type ATPase [Chitinophaga nivalis]MCW3488424.1 cation-translocating P-type ATPase [Chitinophaga nivalis]